MSSLEGRRILVTRAADQAVSFARAVRTRGATPILLPTIAIQPVDDPALLDRALATLPQYAWLVFTSANAVHAIADRLRATGTATGPVRIAVVGPATAAAASERGLSVSATPGHFRGDAIAAELGDLDGAKVLFPRADIGREETANALRARGAEVDEVVAYRTLPPAPDPAGLAELRAGFDVATFTSPSTVRNFVAMVPDARECLSGVLIACIGPVTAGAVTALGLPAPLQAPQATGESLLDAIEEHFRLAGTT